MRAAVASVPDLEPTWVAAISAACTAVLGAIGLWLANRLMGKAAFQQAINAGFKALLDEVQADRTALRSELDAERVRSSAERAQLRGEIINLTQTVESLKALLRSHGVPIPDRKPTEPKAPMIVLETPKDPER